MICGMVDEFGVSGGRGWENCRESVRRDRDPVATGPGGPLGLENISRSDSTEGSRL